MKFDIVGIISEPKYAAIIGAVIGILVKYIENKFSKQDEETKGSGFLGYLKSAAYTAGLLALFSYLMGNNNNISSKGDYRPMSSPYRRRYDGGGMRSVAAAPNPSSFARPRPEFGQHSRWSN